MTPSSLWNVPSTIVRLKNGLWVVHFHGIRRKERFDCLSEASSFLSMLEANEEHEYASQQ